MKPKAARSAALLALDADMLQELRTRLVRLVRRVRRRPGETEVHRLRILTRRWRVVLRTLRPMHGAKPAKRAARRLRRLGRALGERRAWDVALADMRDLHLNPGAHEPGRDAATRALARALKRLDLDALREELKAAEKLAHAVPPVVLAARAEELRAPLVAALSRRARHAGARHALRIRVKKARYLLEACGIAAPAARRLQALLGREHDLHALQAMAGASHRVRALEAQARADTDRALRPALRETIGLLVSLQRESLDGPRKRLSGRRDGRD